MNRAALIDCLLAAPPPFPPGLPPSTTNTATELKKEELKKEEKNMKKKKEKKLYGPQMARRNAESFFAIPPSPPSSPLLRSFHFNVVQFYVVQFARKDEFFKIFFSLEVNNKTHKSLYVDFGEVVLGDVLQV